MGATVRGAWQLARRSATRDTGDGSRPRGHAATAHGGCATRHTAHGYHGRHAMPKVETWAERDVPKFNLKRR